MSRNNLLVVVAALLIPACAVGGPPEDASAKLDLATSTAEEVSGSFEADGVSIKFRFERRGAAASMHVEGADGLALLDSKVENGLEVTTVFADRTFSNEAGRAAAFDADALDELASTPEIQLLPILRKALAQAGVDQALLGAPTSANERGDGEPVVRGPVFCPVRYDSGYGFSWASKLEAEILTR